MLIIRPKKVRLHQLDPAPTIEGFLVNSWNSHYRLLKASVLEAPGRTIELSGEAWVPRERVVFVEKLRS